LRRLDRGANAAVVSSAWQSVGPLAMLPPHVQRPALVRFRAHGAELVGFERGGKAAVANRSQQNLPHVLSRLFQSHRVGLDVEAAVGSGGVRDAGLLVATPLGRLWRALLRPRVVRIFRAAVEGGGQAAVICCGLQRIPQLVSDPSHVNLLDDVDEPAIVESGT